MQLNINSWCINALDNVKKEMLDELVSPLDCKRLRSSQAWVYETENYYTLRSYETMHVAIIDKRTNQLYDLLEKVYERRTRSTSTQIAKFKQDYGDTRIMSFVYRPVKLGSFRND